MAFSCTDLIVPAVNVISRANMLNETDCRTCNVNNSDDTRSLLYIRHESDCRPYHVEVIASNAYNADVCKWAEVFHWMAESTRCEL